MGSPFISKGRGKILTPINNILERRHSLGYPWGVYHRDIHIDFNNAIDPTGKSGISDQNLAEMSPLWLEVHRGLHAMAEMGQVQFTHLPYLEDTLSEVETRAKPLREKFDTMVVLGMGGSALGARALREACLGSAVLGARQPDKNQLHVLDTVDPDYLGRFMETIDPEKTIFNVVSKSGNTVETMAQFLIFYEFLRDRLGEKRFRKHLVLTTDPDSGTLRKLAKDEKLESFSILKGVGGRFSVLSPVGLLPAAFLGISIQELAEGAQRMDKRCKLEDLWTNPAAMLAVVTFWLSERKDRNQFVVFNYSEDLRSSVDWFCQLWAESLGKKKGLKGEKLRTGMTPIAASGPRDQHSQVQLYVEGPQDKMVMFWQKEQFAREKTIPKIHQDHESLSYLGGQKLGEILYAEILATEQALTEAGVPNFKLSTLDTDPYSMGQLFYLLEVATVYVGGLLNVNPYDQPGVELGKKYIYGKLGRKGYEEYGGILNRKLKEKRYLV